MQVVPLKNIPNQSFYITLNDVDYRIVVRTMQGLTFLSVFVNGVPLFYNQLCTPNAFINPYSYVSINGKFYFGCLDEEYPNYKQFGITQNLYFLTNSEVAAL